MKRRLLSATVLSMAVLLLGAAAPANSTYRTKDKTDMNQFKKPTPDELKARLTPEQYKVTQAEGTEAPFKNAYWDNHQPGIYVDVVSGEPLFSSHDKFDSGTGWPSFTRPLEEANVVRREDKNLFMSRTEVRSSHADSHLGHVFDDGPAPTGLRYCMNSASLRFIPASKLVEEGYGKYAGLFGQSDKGANEKKDSGARATATFAGGCFWGVEQLVRKLPGVVDTEVGYTGGALDSPRYDNVKTGSTGHAEAVQVVFDPERLSYEQLLRYFFRLHDPTTVNQQGNDRGTQYRSAIFYHDDAQRRTAERVSAEVDKSGKWKNHLVTEIAPFSKFYGAEDYHQDYLVKHPDGYTCHFWRD